MAEDKWQYLVDLDERLLQGGVILSEWATFLIRDADYAFVAGAHLASIITGLAGIETHLRGEGGSKHQRLVELIDDSDLEEDLKQELQILRKYRNRWVHVAEPWDDDARVPLLALPSSEIALTCLQPNSRHEHPSAMIKTSRIVRSNRFIDSNFARHCWTSQTVALGVTTAHAHAEPWTWHPPSRLLHDGRGIR